MITRKVIKNKALRFWNSGKLCQSVLNNEDIFPFHISANPSKITQKQMLEKYDEVRDWLKILKKGSKEFANYGYSIEYGEAKHYAIGVQKLPAKVYVETLNDFLLLIGKRNDYNDFLKVREISKAVIPDIDLFLSKYPFVAIEYSQVWDLMLNIFTYFKDGFAKGKYLRELQIENVNTKFIELNKKAIKQLLDMFLPIGCIHTEFEKLQNSGFEKRYGLKYEEPLIRFRILDKSCSISGLTDISIPLSDFTKLNINIETIFVTENKMNGLAFPEIDNSIVIFGLGYGIQSLQNISWMKQKTIYYWGDIDTHGFSILSMFRGYYPQVKSILMDDETMTLFKKMVGHEADNKRFIGELKNLTDDENRLYDALRLNNDLHWSNPRLEQERIGYNYLLALLSKKGFFV